MTRLATSDSNGRRLLLGSRYVRKYQEESTNVSMVSVSLVASPPHLGRKKTSFLTIELQHTFPVLQIWGVFHPFISSKYPINYSTKLGGKF